MTDNHKLSMTEQSHRREIAERVRSMILSAIPVEDQDETSLTADYRNYYLQISFSYLHPLMVFCLARAMHHPDNKKKQMTNELNLRSVLGSHAINESVGCYSYRATQWLDSELTPERFFEMLDRYVDEADRGYCKLAG
ncbi:MAG: hypothetical protein QM689_07345 [Oscillospiraceae bacterium]